MPLGILSGIADRLAAFIMAGYCAVTAVLVQAVLGAGRFLGIGREQGPRAALGLPEELLAGVRLSPDRGRPRRARLAGLRRRPARLVAPLCQQPRCRDSQEIRRAEPDRHAQQAQRQGRRQERSQAEHPILASLDGRERGQPPSAVRAGLVRAEGRGRRRSAVEQQARDPLVHGGGHGAAGRLGGRLAREPGAAMDRRAVGPLVDREHGRHPGRAGARGVLLRRGPGLHQDRRQEGPPFRDHRRASRRC